MEEAIIKSLIKDDLRKTKLVHALETVGFVNDDFDLYLFDSIIKLIGIEINFPNDEIAMKYNILLERVHSIETRFNNDALDDLVNVIFDFLILHKTKKR